MENGALRCKFVLVNFYDVIEKGALHTSMFSLLCFCVMHCLEMKVFCSFNVMFFVPLNPFNFKKDAC